jgi:hypothetical protein
MDQGANWQAEQFLAWASSIEILVFFLSYNRTIYGTISEFKTGVFRV